MPPRPRVTFDTELRRRRAAVVFRLLLLIPPAIVLAVWSLAAVLAIVLAWLAALVRGIVPRRLHRFLRAYLGYATQVGAWANLVSGTYPRFRRRREHPVQLEAPRLPQPRLVTLARILLALPGLLLGSVLGVVLAAATVAAWFVSLVRGRTTEGLRELGAFCLRYQDEVIAYLLLLTARMPKLEPPS